MKTNIIAAALFVATACSGANAALTVQTTDFLAGYTNYNGFEGMGSTSSFTGPYTEGGITVEYIGTASIWSDSQAAEGNYSWYPNGGGTGYTRITFGGPINAVEFQAGSGWFGTADSLQYDVLLGAVSVGSGQIAGLSNYTGFKFYGFSGTSFDEVRLQAQRGSVTGFDATAFEAGAYDAINFGGSTSVVPEPAGLALMITGFAIGAIARRRKALAVA